MIQLEAFYGGPSQSGFGSAVFRETLHGTEDLTQAALSTYKTFVGPLWDRFGEPAWMGSWREVYVRHPGTTPDIVAELRTITDPDARLSVPLILDAIDGPDAARAALSAAFDDSAVTELRVFNLGDSAAMSGLLIAARRGVGGEAGFLIVLMD
ncbi:hypothetical protein [Thiocapsa bogorovii]|uniref:hypothetical protein n=1 Tax=Thiocapsa bogorovii TaxID=521689 RepID=UPI001E5B17AA|nr:hypothetical protein [Thiocapsa bogorovii]UHD18638.1 hypothetical protein LT988_11645 [Thiocapsa bogorovii]